MLCIPDLEWPWESQVRNDPRTLDEGCGHARRRSLEDPLGVNP